MTASETPQVGDFGVVPIPGDAGKLIRLGQWLNGDGYADYEHAFIVVDPYQVVEGRPSGAGYQRLAAYPNAVFYRCPDEHRADVARAATRLIGTPYSWLDYFALAARRFHLPLSSALLRQRVTASGHLICSQLVDLAYQRGGVQLFDDGRDPGDVTPGDLYALIAAQRAADATQATR